jgi:endonuclease/exonuclease/phosphatase family metal-dependent hydrolase
VAVVFLIGCLSPWLNPTTWWIIAFAGLLIPYLTIVLLLLLFFWLIAKPRFAVIPLVVLLLGLKQLTVLIAFHSPPSFSKSKDNETIRIVDWNIRSFNGISKNKTAKKNTRTELTASVMRLQPDIVCLQEFNNTLDKQPDNISLFSAMYPYHFFSKDYHRNKGIYQSGCIIFSKYPIIDSGKVAYPVAESLIYIDVLKGDDTIRVYTTHLQSFKFKKEDYDDIDKIKVQEEAIDASKNIFKKMKLAFQRRGVQAKMVRDELDKCAHPSVICGDFNDVPNSYTYFHIKGDRQDAFLKKYGGIGRTYNSLTPALRIDFILPDKRFDVLQFDLVDEDLSDHIMLVTDVKLRK